MSTIKIIFAVLSLSIFASCKQDKDGALTVYCQANINGDNYRDYFSLQDAFLPVQPTLTLMPNSNRLGVVNDSIFAFQFALRNDTNKVLLVGAFIIPQNENFPVLNKEYLLTKNEKYDEDRTTDYHLMHFLGQVNNSGERINGIAAFFDYSKYYLLTTSIDGYVTFDRYDRQSNKLEGNIYLDSQGKLSISYTVKAHFSDILTSHNITLQ